MIDRQPIGVLTITLAATFSSVLVLLVLPAETRGPAGPVLALGNITLWSVLALWRRDAAPPIYDVGVVCLAFTALYSIYPLFAFLMAGGIWTQISDNRLQQWSPDGSAVGTFGWRYVVYTGALAASYLAARGRGTACLPRVRRMQPGETAATLWLLLALTLYFGVLWFAFGVTYYPAYRDVQEGTVGVPQDLPYVLQQISHNFKSILTILKICMIAVLLQAWESRLSRLTLAAWLALEVTATFLRMGARTEALILILSAVFLYHRLVRPLSMRAIVIGGTVLVAMALGHGFARDLATARSHAIAASYWSAANEFQILMGTAYDMHMRQATDILEPAPWQVYGADILRLVPSQLLPFPKVEPTEWYLSQLRLDSRHDGLMFGVIPQAIIGLDWIELLVRGAVLGMLFGLLHRLYIRRADSFWWSIFYLCVCLWSYYTFRASTFYFLYFVLYQFVPTILVVSAGGRLIRAAVAKSVSEQRRFGSGGQVAT